MGVIVDVSTPELHELDVIVIVEIVVPEKHEVWSVIVERLHTPLVVTVDGEHILGGQVVGTIVVGKQEEGVSEVGQVVGVTVIGVHEEEQLRVIVEILVEIEVEILVLKTVSGGSITGGNVVVVVVVETLPDTVEDVHD